MRDFTTLEKLQMKVTKSYGAVLQYGERVFVSDICRDGFYGEIYEFVDTTDEFDLFECRLSLIERVEGVFPDGGHAIVECARRCV